jgi:hypothetical protein
VAQKVAQLGLILSLPRPALQGVLLRWLAP